MILLKSERTHNSTALKIKPEFTFKYNLPNDLCQTIGSVSRYQQSHMG